MPMSRIPPSAPVQAYRTFQISSPTDRTVKAACEQVGCTAWRLGWESKVNEATELGRRQAAYIRAESGRTFREQHTATGLTVFRFESGQRCFADHQTRPEMYVVRDGDHRGNPTGQHRQHERAADWVEDFQDNQGRVADLREKG